MKIIIQDGFIYVNSHRVGYWWKDYDKRVSLSYGVGEDFYANDFNEVKQEILSILKTK